VVTPDEKHARSQRLLALSEQKTHAFYARYIGQEVTVLVERTASGEVMHGFTDNYIRVEMKRDDALDNQLVRVRLGDFNEAGDALLGERII
jgi:threonylcarbamoyladenosine tRNA methylthiotransferase MtaB